MIASAVDQSIRKWSVRKVNHSTKQVEETRPAFLVLQMKEISYEINQNQTCLSILADYDNSQPVSNHSIRCDQYGNRH